MLEKCQRFPWLWDKIAKNFILWPSLCAGPSPRTGVFKHIVHAGLGCIAIPVQSVGAVNPVSLLVTSIYVISVAKKPPVIMFIFLLLLVIVLGGLSLFLGLDLVRFLLFDLFLFL